MSWTPLSLLLWFSKRISWFPLKKRRGKGSEQLLTWGRQICTGSAGEYEKLFHLHGEKDPQQSYGEYAARRLPVSSRGLLQTSMCLVAIDRISATFYCPPGRADLLRMLKRSTRSKMRVEAVTRTSHLEKCFWDSSHEKLSLPSSCWMTQHRCQSTSCSTCSLHIAFFGRGLGSIVPVPAAPRSSSSQYRCFVAGKGCAAHRSTAFSLIALATEYHLDPFFHNLWVVCVMSSGF